MPKRIPSGLLPSLASDRSSMEPRQLFSDPTADPTSTDEAVNNALNCASYNLPEGGILRLPNGEIITLGAGAAFKPPSCGPLAIRSVPNIIASSGGVGGTTASGNLGLKADDESHISDFRDPFYASTFPQCYALSATTIIAYTLVIMLFITPRSFLDGGVVVLGRKGFTNGGGGTSIGGRPWLQKVAALSVAISLTIANAATFRVAERQYSWGVQNAKQLQEDVLGGTELKIIRIISNTFLWLAQAQTLIRLFPRQREKVIIKWTAFALITLDVIFQSLNSFKYGGSDLTQPKFTEAVPALSYLFALALGVLYAAWVLYYSIMKKRYAFYHPLMKNMILVAALSVVSILVPVVFFILDISKPDFAGWETMSDGWGLLQLVSLCGNGWKELKPWKEKKRRMESWEEKYSMGTRCWRHHNRNIPGQRGGERARAVPIRKIQKVEEEEKTACQTCRGSVFGRRSATRH